MIVEKLTQNEIISFNLLKYLVINCFVKLAFLFFILSVIFRWERTNSTWNERSQVMLTTINDSKAFRLIIMVCIGFAKLFHAYTPLTTTCCVYAPCYFLRQMFVTLSLGLLIPHCFFFIQLIIGCVITILFFIV